jgi:hypothetical protein
VLHCRLLGVQLIRTHMLRLVTRNKPLCMFVENRRCEAKTVNEAAFVRVINDKSKGEMPESSGGCDHVAPQLFSVSRGRRTAAVLYTWAPLHAARNHEIDGGGDAQSPCLSSGLHQPNLAIMTSGFKLKTLNPMFEAEPFQAVRLHHGCLIENATDNVFSPKETTRLRLPRTLKSFMKTCRNAK